MPEHEYQQYCALARTLDVAGDRWTLLIVRELTPGPRRFTDLLDGLQGVSRKLLTERLRALERDGIIARREPRLRAHRRRARSGRRDGPADRVGRQAHRRPQAGRQLPGAVAGGGDG